MTKEEAYMHRCLELAALGRGFVAPNPMVGAVLVYDNRIIGEGYHMLYGGPHAEVNCINSVKPENRECISKSTLYVSLEPCNHFGKTPPCSDLIIKNRIPEVVIACSDPFEKVNGSGIHKLREAGVKVATGILEKEAISLNTRFFTFHLQKRPYIILKWAQSANKKISGKNGQPIRISHSLTDRLVHRWRSEEAAIMVGASTALNDNPSLTTRLWKGKNPVRIVADNQLKITASFSLYNNESPLIVFNCIKNEVQENLEYIKYGPDENLVSATVSALYERSLQSLIVEGGAKLLQSFIEKNAWDEIRVITNLQLNIEEGVAAPEFQAGNSYMKDLIAGDRIDYYKRSA